MKKVVLLNRYIKKWFINSFYDIEIKTDKKNIQIVFFSLWEIYAYLNRIMKMMYF